MTAHRSLRQVVRRRVLLPALLIAPAILTALGVSAIEVSRLWWPKSSLFGDPFYYSLADAIEAHDLRAAYGFLRAGHDPNSLIAVRHPILTGGRSVLISPLLWAVAMQSKDIVLMLLGFGARLDRPGDREAPCLAEALGNAEIASLLRRYGEALPTHRCPVQEPGATLRLSAAGF